MSELCPFADECPMEVDIIDVSGACKDTRGEVCGPVAMYGMLLNQYESLETLDEVLPIQGSFTIDTVPKGTPPLDVREQWVGVELPVRVPKLLKYGAVSVAPADAILSLLAFGKLDAASWFIAFCSEMAPLGPSWTFDANEGIVREKLPVNSVDYYGSRIDNDIRQRISEEA